MIKNPPLRKCVVTQERLPKGDLLRVVKSKEGIVSVDLTGKAQGRGAYIKKDLNVLSKAKKNGALSKALECTITDEVFEQIEKTIKENE